MLNDITPHSAGDFEGERLTSSEYLPDAFAQRRKLDGKHLVDKVEIVTEFAIVATIFQIAVIAAIGSHVGSISLRRRTFPNPGSEGHAAKLGCSSSGMSPTSSKTASFIRQLETVNPLRAGAANAPRS